MNDNKFTRYVRPTSLVVTTSFFLILMLVDGNVGTFCVKEAYLRMLETILVTQYAFYFSSRGAEKIADTVTQLKILREQNKTSGTKQKNVNANDLEDYQELEKFK